MIYVGSFINLAKIIKSNVTSFEKIIKKFKLFFQIVLIYF